MNWCLPWLSACTLIAALVGTAQGSSSDSARSHEVQAAHNAFDHLFEVIKSKDPTTRDVIAMFDQTYRSFFAPLQNSATIAKLKPSEIVELFNDADSAQYMTNETRYIGDMELDLRQLERIGHASQAQYDSLYEALIGSRMFGEADQLRSAHGSAVMLPVPKFTDVSSKRKAAPTAIVVQADGRKLTRRDVDLDMPVQILVVVSPWCHFAQHSLRDIANDPDLGKAFAQHATWLVPPEGTAIADVLLWNRTHPREEMMLAYNYYEWPMIDRWELPTFYFLRKGRVVSEVVGWPGRGRKAELIAALHRVSLLPALK